MSQQTRRSWLTGAATAAAGLPGILSARDPAAPGATRIRRVEVGPPTRFNRPGHVVLGDTWATAWADDDRLYVVVDDTPGFDMVLRSSRDRNVALGTLDGSPPGELRGAIVNGMEAFGRANQLGSDGASWKGNGIASVDGVLYLSVSRHWYHVKEYDRRQIARHASILKSQDRGKTWAPAPRDAEPLPDPLFPGPRFATPFFLDAGRDGRPPRSAPDEAERYVYAVSSDGYWDNGNALHLGRVRRADLPKLDLATWEFFCGFREGGTNPVWRPGKPGLEACYPILSAPFAFGQTGMVHVAPLQTYLLVAWRYPLLDRDSWNVRTSVWDFYEAEAPWGPWRLVGSKRWEGEGFYNPSLPTKFVSRDGRRLWALTAGDFDTWNQPPETTLYTLFLVPITLVTA